jgi:hypothetical protein
MTERARIHASGGISLLDGTDPTAGFVRVAGNATVTGYVNVTGSGGWLAGSLAGRRRLDTLGTSNGFRFLTDSDGYANVELGTLLVASTVSFGGLGGTNPQITFQSNGSSARMTVFGGSTDSGFAFRDTTNSTTWGWVLAFSNGVHIFAPNGSHAVVMANSTFGPNTTNVIDLGATGARFRDLWLSRDATIANRVGIFGAAASGAALSVGSSASNDSVGINFGTSSSPERGNIFFHTDGTGWRLNIGKVQSGTFTTIIGVRDDNSVTMAGALTVTGTPTFNSQSIHAAGLRVNTDQQAIYQRGSYTAGSGDWPYLPIIVSTSAASGTAPENTIWIQVPA